MKWDSSYIVFGILTALAVVFVFFLIFSSRQADFKILASSKEIQIMAESACSKLTESKDYITGKTVNTCYKHDWKKWVNNIYPITVGKLKSKIQGDSGVEVPATQILVYPDKTKRLIFNGCRPHACPDAEVFFLLDTTNKNMDIVWNVDGETKYFGPNAELLEQNNIYASLNEYK